MAAGQALLRNRAHGNGSSSLFLVFCVFLYSGASVGRRSSHDRTGDHKHPTVVERTCWCHSVWPVIKKAASSSLWGPWTRVDGVVLDQTVGEWGHAEGKAFWQLMVSFDFHSLLSRTDTVWSLWKHKHPLWPWEDSCKNTLKSHIFFVLMYLFDNLKQLSLHMMNIKCRDSGWINE